MKTAQFNDDLIKVDTSDDTVKFIISKEDLQFMRLNFNRNELKDLISKLITDEVYDSIYLNTFEENGVPQF